MDQTGSPLQSNPQAGSIHSSWSIHQAGSILYTLSAACTAVSHLMHTTRNRVHVEPAWCMLQSVESVWCMPCTEWWASLLYATEQWVCCKWWTSLMHACYKAASHLMHAVDQWVNYIFCRQWWTGKVETCVITWERRCPGANCLAWIGLNPTRIAYFGSDGCKKVRSEFPPLHLVHTNLFAMSR